jgi:glycosyltransferase involved in cell wall biosynthesis
MRVVLVSGIFPPDIGGPATHASNLREDLARRGHKVVVLTLCDGARGDKRSGLIRYPRNWPWPFRLAAVTAWLLRHRFDYDVVYATGLHPAAVAGARLARRPVLVKVVGDSAWERGARIGLTNKTFSEFQQSSEGGLRLRAMVWLQHWAIQSATRVTVPSEYLRRTVENWVGNRLEITVIPNGVLGAPPSVPPRHKGRELQAIFVGRLVPHKRVEVLVDAVAMSTGVKLEIIGEGPALPGIDHRIRELGLEARVGLRGALSHGEVLRHIADADLFVTASEYEGLPHVAIEALTCGTPVVAPDLGGLKEVLRDGVNGVLVSPSTGDAFAQALASLRDNNALVEHLAGNAARDGRYWRFEYCAQKIEALLKQLVRTQPRAVFLGKTWIPSPPGEDLKRKFEILGRHLNVTLVAVGPHPLQQIGSTTVIAFPLLRPKPLGSLVYYSLAPAVAFLLALGRRNCSIVCQSPFEALGVVLISRFFPQSARPGIVIEAHGHWHIAARLSGARARRIVAPLADRLTGWSLRRADRVRVVGRDTEGLVRREGYEGELDRFVAFSDFTLFVEPLPASPPKEPRVAFVGVFEDSKAIDVLLDAWKLVAESFPLARLLMAGDGPRLNRLRRRSSELRLNESAVFLGRLSAPEVRDLLDTCCCLVLPSRSEGHPRVVLEAMARARPVVGTDVGDVPNMVVHGRTGLIVPAEDTESLASAIIQLLRDRSKLRLMGEEGRRLMLERDPLMEFEGGIARLASWTDHH